MSKPKLVVLGFLDREPMYGYQIGHVVEEYGLPVWGGIRLPSIYKALQGLEASKHIHGEQVSEGNNPPRTVFHINDKGRKLHSELVHQYLSSPQTSSADWWLTLSFAWKAVSKEVLEDSIQARIARLQRSKAAVQVSSCQQEISKGSLPFVHRHIMQLGMRHHRVELKTLKELREDLLSDDYDDFFMNRGD